MESSEVIFITRRFTNSPPPSLPFDLAQCKQGKQNKRVNKKTPQLFSLTTSLICGLIPGGWKH